MPFRAQAIQKGIVLILKILSSDGQVTFISPPDYELSDVNQDNEISQHSMVAHIQVFMTLLLMLPMM